MKRSQHCSSSGKHAMHRMARSRGQNGAWWHQRRTCGGRRLSFTMSCFRLSQGSLSLGVADHHERRGCPSANCKVHWVWCGRWRKLWICVSSRLTPVVFLVKVCLQSRMPLIPKYLERAVNVEYEELLCLARALDGTLRGRVTRALSETGDLNVRPSGERRFSFAQV